MAEDNASTGPGQTRSADPQPDRLGGKPATASDRATQNFIEDGREITRATYLGAPNFEPAYSRVAARINPDQPNSLLKELDGKDEGFKDQVKTLLVSAVENDKVREILKNDDKVWRELQFVSKSSEQSTALFTTTAGEKNDQQPVRYVVRANLERGEFEIQRETNNGPNASRQIERVDRASDYAAAVLRAQSLADRDKAAQENKKPEDKDDINLDMRAALLARLEKRYVRAIGNAGDRYHFRDDLSVVAFEFAVSALGKTQLKTDHDDPNVVRSMVDHARAEGWTSIHIKGTDDFKREAWLAASMAGLEVKGYKAKDQDQALLEELKRERATIENKYEQQGTRSRATGRPARDLSSNDGQVVDETKVTKPQETALIAIDQTLRERGDSEPQIKMAVSMAREQFQQKRVYAGELKEHGAAHYEFNDRNEKSYYVKLEAANGHQQTVWGVHLPEALKQGEAKLGDQVFVAYQGRTAVTIKVPDRDTEGKVTGSHEITTHRNTWAIERFDKLSALAKGKLSELAGETSKQPVVRQYDHVAIPRTPNIPPPKPERPSERQR